MTQLLQQALAEVEKLSVPAQDAMAVFILEEIEDDWRWEQAFAVLRTELARLAAKAREDVRAGRVKNMSLNERS